MRKWGDHLRNLSPASNFDPFQDGVSTEINQEPAAAAVVPHVAFAFLPPPPPTFSLLLVSQKNA